MAFWLAPGEKSGSHPAKNTRILSNHLLTKRVRIGYRDLPHVVSYDVTFLIPIGGHHTNATFEALTGYMPPDFERFWKFNSDTGDLEALSDGPGEQPWPVVLATANNRYAMGIYSPEKPAASYGRFRFATEEVNKWNCVFRVRNPDGIAAGEYSFRTFVMVGDLETVRRSLQRLHTWSVQGKDLGQRR